MYIELLFVATCEFTPDARFVKFRIYSKLRPHHNTTQHLHYTTHSHTQHNTTQHNTTQHNTTQHNTTQHSTAQRNTTHNTAQHSAAHRSAAQRSTAQHSTAQPNTTKHVHCIAQYSITRNVTHVQF